MNTMIEMNTDLIEVEAKEEQTIELSVVDLDFVGGGSCVVLLG